METTTSTSTAPTDYTDTSAPSEPDGAKDLTAAIEDTENQLPELPNPLPDQHPDFRFYIPPTPPTYPHKSVFLAGSIEMGRAIQWQQHMRNYLADLPITVCNPRRSAWDTASTPRQRQADMQTQISWELEALDKCDVICFFFDWTTMSPVTMMELGLWARSGKCVVCCDDGQADVLAGVQDAVEKKRFWKGTNVRMVCERYGVPHVRNFMDLTVEVRKMLVRKGMQMPEGRTVEGPW